MTHFHRSHRSDKSQDTDAVSGVNTENTAHPHAQEAAALGVLDSHTESAPSQGPETTEM